MRYPQFLVDTYETEIEKVLGVWAMFEDEDLKKRPIRRTSGGGASTSMEAAGFGPEDG